MLDGFQLHQRKVKEIARSAGRIQHPKAAQPFLEAVLDRGGAPGGRGGGAAKAAFGAGTGQQGRDLGPGRRPFCQQRVHDHRRHDLHDLGAVGVMGTKLAALVGVKPAFKQGAKDRGVDVGPVQRGGADQVVDILPGQGQGVVGIKQPAVEPLDLFESDQPAAAHGGEQGAGMGGEGLGLLAGGLDHALEHLARQQVHILGEHAKHQPVDEMRHRLRRVAAPAQPLRDGGKVGGGLLGQQSPGLGGFQRLGVQKAIAQAVAGRGVGQVFKLDGAGLLDGVGPVGVDADHIHIRHDQQRRVVEGDGIALQLGKGGVEVGSLALVFPAKAILAPDIGPALAAGGLGGTLLEGEPVAGRVGADRIGYFQQAAEVVEMALRGRAFLQLDPAPLGDEFLRRRHGAAFCNAGAGI